MSKFFIGIDPDLHDTGFALLSDDGYVLQVNVVRVPRSYKGEDAVREMIKQLANSLPLWISDRAAASAVAVVEGQQIYCGKSQARPDSILLLAQVAGAAAGILRSSVLGTPHVVMPRPRKWKGDVPKPIHQARILSGLGLHYKKTQGYSYPTNPPAHLNTLKPTEWKHVVDAIGLAQWAINP